MMLRLVSPLIAAAVLAASAAPAQQLNDCKPPGKAPFLVFLSEPAYTKEAFPDRARMLTFFNRLQQYLDQRQDLEMAGLQDIDVRVARCENRVPAIDGSSYSDVIVRTLYDRSVVVEVWGALDAKRGPNKVLQPSAQMNYLLVPLRHRAAAGKGKVEDILRFNYPDGEINAPDFVDLVSNYDLHAMIAAAVGVMAYDGEDFGLAHQMACRAHAQLGGTERRLSGRPENKAQAQLVSQLRSFLVSLARLSVEELRKKPGSLSQLLNPQAPCSEEVK